MKHLRTLVPLIVLILASCTTLSDRRAYESIKSTNALVQTALSAWADYCAAVEGTPSEITAAQHAKVKYAYDRYTGLSVAVTSAFCVKNKPSTERIGVLLTDLSKAAGEFIAATTSLPGPKGVQ